MVPGCRLFYTPVEWREITRGGCDVTMSDIWWGYSQNGRKRGGNRLVAFQYIYRRRHSDKLWDRNWSCTRRTDIRRETALGSLAGKTVTYISNRPFKDPCSYHIHTYVVMTASKAYWLMSKVMMDVHGFCYLHRIMFQK